MALFSGLAKMVNNIPGIGLSEITETKADWKSSLLSGREGNDPVTLHLGKMQNGNTLLISESDFSEKLVIKNVGELINSDSLTLGYPMYYIKEALGLKEIPLNTAYPLLYRSASVILEAERLHIQNAVLILHTSEPSKVVTNFYEDFADLLCSGHQLNYFHQSQQRSRANFYFGLFNTNKKQIY